MASWGKPNQSVECHYNAVLKVGQMTRTIWVTFLVGQVHGSDLQTKLSGWDPDITCSFGSDECTEIPLVQNQLITYLKLF